MTEDVAVPAEPVLATEHGTLFEGDSIGWLRTLPDASVRLVFADPPYNLRKAAWDTFASHQAYVDWSLDWISEVSRVLTEDGSLYVCGFPEILADVKGPALRHFHSCRWLVWHYRNKANLGSDWGRSHEAILHFRASERTRIDQDPVRIPYGAHTLRYPDHPQAESSAFGQGRPARADSWQPHPLGAKPKDVIEVPTTCNGMGEKTPHPTQKPEELVRKFVLASSAPGDVVLDPFSGSGTTVVVAEQLGRRWLGCELDGEYNRWAVKRLENVRRMPVEEWIALDRDNARRRASIR